MTKITFTPEVYAKFRDDVLEVINNKNIFEAQKIKVLIGIMGSGKSYFQGNELPEEQLKAFPKLKFIIRVAPKNETCDDGIFPKENNIGGKKFKYRDISHISKDLTSQMDEMLDDCVDTNNVYIFSITHARFSNHFKSFLKYAKVSVLWIEEVHEFLAVGDPGSLKYGFGTGYRSGFDAKVALRLRRWMRDNGRVLSFTATPTLHQSEYDEYIEERGAITNQKFSDLFHKCNDLWNEDVTLSSAIPNQAWVNNTIAYDLTKRDTQNSVSSFVGDMVDSLLHREKLLDELKKKDPRIKSKLTSLIKCGQGGGVWGCPIHKGPFGGSGKRDPVEHDYGMVQIVGLHLQKHGFDPNMKMIATLQQSGVGNRIWDLYGNAVETKLTWNEVQQRLLDNDDPLRHLIVVNRGGSGINVYNMGAIFIAAVRDAIWSRDHIPNQVFGRGVRSNWGYGNITNQYINDLRNFLADNQLNDIETIVNTIKIANKLDIWYPQDTYRKTKCDVWSDSIEIFRDKYCNSVKVGHQWLHEYTGTKPSIDLNLLPIDLTIERECNGEMVKYDISKEVTEWKCDGTLTAFFENC